MGFLDDLIYGLRDTYNASGTLMPRRSKLKFAGGTLVDDSVNGWTLFTAVGSVPSGTGLAKVSSGAFVSPASLLVNADVDPAAAIQYSKLLLALSIVNGDIATSAAIAGTKISPNFGSQAVTTTGDVTANHCILGGGTPATVGLLRLPYNGASAVTVVGWKDSGGTDRAWLTYGSGDVWQIGYSTATSGTITGGSSLTCTGGTTTAVMTSTSWALTAAGVANALVVNGTQITSTLGGFQSANNAKATENNNFPVNIQTTTAALTTVATIAIPTNSTVQILAMVDAIGNSQTQGAAYIRLAAFRNNGGTVTQINTTQDGGTLEDNAAWDCQINPSGTNALVQVQGAAGVTVQWGGIVTALTVVP